MIQTALERVLDGHDLSQAEARETMGSIMAGEEPVLTLPVGRDLLRNFLEQ